MGAMITLTLIYSALVYFSVLADLLKLALMVIIIIFSIWYSFGMVRMIQRRTEKIKEKQIKKDLELYAQSGEEE